MLDDFDAHKAIAEASERHEHAVGSGEGTHASKPHARWVPLAAALLAVVAAIASLLSNKSGTQAMSLKNQAIFLRTEAADSYSFYESKSIKQHLYEALEDANPTMTTSVRAKLATVAKREKAEKVPIFEKARLQEEQAKSAIERSDRFAHAHEVMEGGVTLFEVAIAIVSIAALTSSTFLIYFAAVAAAGGLGIILYGLSLQ